ncbi:DUF551 domain-containing protein [Escherichia coli]|uniref:DUF551 domain-containing protein n=2 Tax=Escherichia coli TaxID=562 RepID=UPI0001B5B39E|nr:DUF551 domain-containing protein [Escherichia coli]BAI35068.1 hypothetical protein ECO111_1120 [Escherichia coli O111:H- str. 11128]
MTTITREQALKIIEAADEVISALAGTNEDVHPGSDNMLRLWDDLNDRYAPPEVVRELARIALASLEAKPIGAFHIAEQQVDGTSDYIKDGEWPIDNGIIEVYAAPPMPVVPEEKPMPNPLKMYAVDAVAAIAEVRGWNACRAAMLHAEPVSNSDELPLDYLQGHKDGLEWAAQQAEANHPQTGDWLYDDPIELARAIRKGPDIPEFKSVSVDEDDNFYSWFGRFWYENYQKNNYTTSAKQMLGTMAEFAYRAGRESAALAGNSPVIPDGWISCSERMPAQDDWILIYSKHGEYMAGQVQGEYVELSDGTLSWLGNALFWMPLPEPPRLKEL